VQVELGDPVRLVERAGLDVDVLHAAVGHHDELAEERSPGDVELLVLLGVPPPPGVAPDQPPPPADDGRQDDERGEEEQHRSVEQEVEGHEDGDHQCGGDEQQPAAHHGEPGRDALPRGSRRCEEVVHAPDPMVGG
jgi:hypothetical protein